MVLFQEILYFPAGRSARLYVYIGYLLDAGKQTDVIYMDISKAFDD
jgi:hypothetical protein